MEIVAQPFDMNLFLNREVDAAAAMTYNELAQVLEQKNPDTGELYTLDDLNVIKMSDLGTGALEDGIFVSEDWIADEANQDIATRFLKASFKGWIYCRDNPDDCVQYVLDNGPDARRGAPALADERDQQADLAERQRDRRDERGRLRHHGADRPGLRDHQERGVRRRVYTTDYAQAAVDELEDEGVDVNGEDYETPEVEVTEGGEVGCLARG